MNVQYLQDLYKKYSSRINNEICWRNILFLADNLQTEDEDINIAAIMRSLRKLENKMDILLSGQNVTLVDLRKNMDQQIHQQVVKSNVTMAKRNNVITIAFLRV